MLSLHAKLSTIHYPLSTTHCHFFCAFFLLTGVVGLGAVHRSSITLTAVALKRCAASPFFPSAPGRACHEPVSFTFAPAPVFNSSPPTTSTPVRCCMLVRVY